MTADRARGALAVLQDADGKFLCEVPCGYIVDQTARTHNQRRERAQRRRRAMLRQRVALAVAFLTVAALLAVAYAVEREQRRGQAAGNDRRHG